MPVKSAAMIAKSAATYDSKKCNLDSKKVISKMSVKFLQQSYIILKMTPETSVEFFN